jgi:hypothetical protein
VWLPVGEPGTARVVFHAWDVAAAARLRIEDISFVW